MKATARYFLHNSPSLFAIQNQMNLINDATSYVIFPNMIFIFYRVLYGFPNTMDFF